MPIPRSAKLKWRVNRVGIARSLIGSLHRRLDDQLFDWFDNLQVVSNAFFSTNKMFQSSNIIIPFSLSGQCGVRCVDCCCLVDLCCCEILCVVNLYCAMNSAKMWGGGGGGGYFNDSMQSSPGQDKQSKKKIYKAQNCVPVSIQQIKNSTDDEFKVGRSDVHMVTIVGLLVKMDVDSTKTTYLFDDQTGLLNAFVFNVNDDDTVAEKHYPLNQYYRVHGSVRMRDRQHHIMVFHMEPLECLDELTMHLLEVIYAPLSLEEEKLQENGQGAAMNNTAMNTNNSHMQNDNAFNDSMDMGQANNSGLTPQQQQVYNLIKNSTSSTGIDRDEIPNGLQNRINGKEIDKILDFLISEGHIYTTTDEKHFRTTDG